MVKSLKKFTKPQLPYEIESKLSAENKDEETLTVMTKDSGPLRNSHHEICKNFRSRT